MEDQWAMNPDIQALVRAKMYDPISTFDLFKNRLAEQDFLTDLTKIFESKDFQDYFKGPRQYDAKIHVEKVELVSQDVKNFLISHQLIQPNPHDVIWHSFERRAALLYMATLAKHMARTIPGYIPATSVKQYHDFLYRKSLDADGIFCTQILLPTLPEPKEDVPMSRIIEFRQQHQQELDHLRAEIRNFEARIKQAGSLDQINDVGNEFAEKIDHGLRDLERDCRQDRIELQTGSIITFLESKPNLWDAVVLGAGLSAGTAFFLPIGIGVVALYGGIRVAAYIMTKQNENFVKLEENAFAFLHNARTENLI